MKLKISTWADFMFILTAAFIIFCIVIYSVPYYQDMYKLVNGEYVKVTSDITIAQYWSITNEHLKGFKFVLLMAGCGAAAFLIDIFFTRPILNRYTKLGKLERAEIKKKWKEFKDGKSDERTDQ